MKNLLILLLFLTTLQNTQAQQPITFERVYSDSGVVVGTSIRQTFDGGYIIAGARSAPLTWLSNDGTLMKTDSLGNVEWVKVYGNPFGDDLLEDVQQTADSGYIACGVFPEIGMADNLYIVKTDKEGDTLWTKIYGSNLLDYARSIKQTYDGGYVITGIWQENLGFVFRLNAQGDTVWTKYLYPPSGISMYSIAQTADSGFVAAGLSYDTVLYIQTYIVCLDKYGNIIWEKNYGYGNYDDAHDIKVLLDGNYIVGGYSWQFSNSYDSYLLKLDTNGDTLWTSLLSIPRENGIVELAITNGGDIVSAEAESTIANKYQNNITKTNSMGNLLWRREYGGAEAEYIHGITICKDGGYAICADTESYGLIPQKYVVKTNENGLLTALVEIEDKKNVPIKIGPNPFEDIIYIDLTELLDKDYQVVLYDVLGIELINKTVRGGTTAILPIDLPLPAAAYFLQIRDKEKVYVAVPLVRR